MANTSVTWQQAAHTTDQPPSPSKGHTKKRTSQQKVFMHFLQRKKPREGAISGNRRRPKKKKKKARQENKRRTGKNVEWNDSRGIPDRGKTSDIFGLPGGNSIWTISGGHNVDIHRQNDAYTSRQTKKTQTDSYNPRTKHWPKTAWSIACWV